MDLRDFRWMPLDVNALLTSDFWLTTPASPAKAGTELLLRSWHQTPAASLPDNDEVLAGLAGMRGDVETWRQWKAQALMGWALCADGRWHHPVIAESAATSWERKRKEAKRREDARTRQARKRAKDNENKRETVTRDDAVTSRELAGDEGVTSREPPCDVTSLSALRHANVPADRTGQDRTGESAAFTHSGGAEFLDRLYDAVGVDPSKSPNWAVIYPALERWRAHGLDDETILTVAAIKAASLAQRGKGPMSSPAFLDGAMRDAASQGPPPAPMPLGWSDAPETILETPECAAAAQRAGMTEEEARHECGQFAAKKRRKTSADWLGEFEHWCGCWRRPGGRTGRSRAPGRDRSGAGAGADSSHNRRPAGAGRGPHLADAAAGLLARLQEGGGPGAVDPGGGPRDAGQTAPLAVLDVDRRRPLGAK